MTNNYFTGLCSIKIIIGIVSVVGCKTHNYTPISHFTEVSRIRDLSTNDDILKDSSITISIQYAHPVAQHGTLPIILIVKLKNISDSIRYIEEPLESSTEDPSCDNFNFHVTTQYGWDVFTDDPDVSDGGARNYRYIKLNPHDSVLYRARIRGAYDFHHGKKYHIRAMYHSKGLIVKDSFFEKVSWFGIIYSNVVDFDY